MLISLPVWVGRVGWFEAEVEDVVTEHLGRDPNSWYVISSGEYERGESLYFRTQCVILSVSEYGLHGVGDRVDRHPDLVDYRDLVLQVVPVVGSGFATSTSAVREEWEAFTNHSGVVYSRSPYVVVNPQGGVFMLRARYGVVLRDSIVFEVKYRPLC